MENQGYEEEAITRPFNRQYSMQSSPTSGENTRSSPTTAVAAAAAAQGVGTAIAVRHLRAEPEAHVYEDIVVSGVEDSIPADRLSSLPTNAANNNNHHWNELNSLHWSNTAQNNSNNARHFLSANEPILLSSERVSSHFHRNLTLPLSGSVKTPDAATNPSRFSVRVTNKERNGCLPIDNLSSLCESSAESSRLGGETMTVNDSTSRPNVDKPCGRRRRKKDCKHCKSKTNGGAFRAELLPLDSIADSTMHQDAPTIFPVDVSSGRLQTSENNQVIGRENKTRVGLEPIFTLPNGKLPSFNCQRSTQGISHTDPRGTSIFSISNNINISCPPASGPKPLNYDKNDTDLRLVPIEHSDDRALITPMKNRANGMKVNSIYSQDHWHYKDVPVFVTDVKEQSPFQRAYSLPTRTQTPSSQNRVNLRRSVRGEPPPHPAQLRKNRHGWTLHFARPLDGTRCTRSIVLLFITILTLLGIGGIALYIVFEPEKLQIIQQYLRSSSTPNVLTVSNVSNDTYESSSSSSIDYETESTETSTFPTVNMLFTESLSSFSQDTTVYPQAETEVILSTDPTTVLDPNATRHCDDCYGAEVCVALVDEEVPFCRNGPDPLDPTGCAGLCLINKQKCHRLDVDAFRCVEVEHYCLDDEWTCSNTLCIPLIKHCDGHMNCYDHSDEYDCACDLQTHFQCGNETSCLPLERRCDGKIDCWDATDEINCTLGQDLGWSCPSSGDFTCSNGECILKARFCDGLRDCTDGSDEPSGCQGRCNKHEFSCHNGRCITKAMKCNGIDDCDDGSDEQHCRDRIK